MLGIFLLAAIGLCKLTAAGIFGNVLMYLPFFFLFYIGNSIRVNITNRVEGWSEFKSTFISCLGNSIGLIAIMEIGRAHV